MYHYQMGSRRYSCPENCPNRSIHPNCHNVETCETYRKYREMVDLKREEERKRTAMDCYIYANKFNYDKKLRAIRDEKRARA